MIYQPQYKNLKLVPFYTLQDTHYIIYWPYSSTDSLPALLATMKEKERAKQVLDSRTINMVNTGEQQPENDDGFKGEKQTIDCMLNAIFVMAQVGSVVFSEIQMPMLQNFN